MRRLSRAGQAVEGIRRSWSFRKTAGPLGFTHKSDQAQAGVRLARPIGSLGPLPETIYHNPQALLLSGKLRNQTPSDP